MKRSDFLRGMFSLAAIAAVPDFIKKNKDGSIEQEDDTVIGVIKYKGKKYALGFRLEKDPNKDQEYLDYLSRAMRNTLSAVVHKDPKFAALAKEIQNDRS